MKDQMKNKNLKMPVFKEQKNKYKKRILKIKPKQTKMIYKRMPRN